jgi:phosphohistidine phosphatase
MKKTLILLRHAKAEAGQDDHARPLAARGVEEAKLIGAYLRKQGIAPQKILCSTSKRTRQTLEGLSIKGNIEFSDATYNASEKQHRENIAAQPDNISSLMVIAHNPGLHQLAVELARVGDAKLRRQLAMEFPPCSLVVIDLGDMAWSDIFTARGTLELFVTPRMLA